MNETSDKGLYERIYDAVLQVPLGHVATYGDIAAMVGGCDARTVGYALNELPKWRDQEVPWQRIINSQGGISTRGVRQRERLEAEGIVFDARGRVSLARFRWRGAAPAEDDDDGQLSLF
jgi:methylated-DNA-protein-cysteine methyltransferase-like protein